MQTPTIFTTTFIASVLPEYVNYGVCGYMIGTTDFRSINSLTNALTTAFGKDLGTYLFLEVQIVYNKGSEKRQAICTKSNYSAVIDAIEEELDATKMTMEDLLGE